ncbi:MAG: hypothetical protein ACOYBO_13280 [Azonexus sp.]
MAENIIEDKLHLFAFNLETHYGDLNQGDYALIGADYGTVVCLLSEVGNKMHAITKTAKDYALGRGFKLQNLSFTFTVFNRID